MSGTTRTYLSPQAVSGTPLREASFGGKRDMIVGLGGGGQKVWRVSGDHGTKNLHSPFAVNLDRS